MPTYKLEYTIEVDADTPLEAARVVDGYMQQRQRIYGPYFHVTDTHSGKEWEVDLFDNTVEEK
jgi:hypothetical protein